MTEEECLGRFGLCPNPIELQDIRRLLVGQTVRERASQGDGDTELMKLCCVQLYFGGQVEDALVIWEAKTSSMDADASIDLQLLCGAGLESTLSFLESQSSPAGKRLRSRVEAGDFQDFQASDYARFWSDYYGRGSR